MTKVTLNAGIPAKIELVPIGFTTVEANTIVVADNVTPDDLAMNFHTYTVTGTTFIRDNGVPIDARILNNPTFSYANALEVAASSPVLP